MQGGTPNQENTMQEMTSDVNPESNDTSRGIASSTTEHVRGVIACLLLNSLLINISCMMISWLDN